MGEIVILYWRDIPSQVVAREGRKQAKRMLSPRFVEAIDRAAMRSGAHGSDDYLAEWRRSEARPCGDDLDVEVDAVATQIEAAFDDARLDALARAGGREAARA